MTRRPAHESLLLELSDQDYNLWRHQPITAAYLQHLSDQIEAFRTSASDLLEEGRLLPQEGELRGRLLMLRELQSLSLEHIKNFYRQEETEETSGTASD
jgi:hypothetical protein